MIKYYCDKCKCELKSESEYKSNVIDVKGRNEFMGTRGNAEMLHFCKKCYDEFWNSLKGE